MSKIKNGGLDQYGARAFEQQQFTTAGVEGVKQWSSCSRWWQTVLFSVAGRTAVFWQFSSRTTLSDAATASYATLVGRSWTLTAAATRCSTGRGWRPPTPKWTRAAAVIRRPAPLLRPPRYRRIGVAVGRHAHRTTWHNTAECNRKSVMYWIIKTGTQWQ